MKTQIRIKKNFSIRDPKTGRHYTFVKDTIAKGKQIQFATTARIKNGQFEIEEILPTDASIIRRRDGRYNWHMANLTDPKMDMEFVLLDTLASRFGSDELRTKGSGQTSMFSRCADACLTEFESGITVELSEGSDDPFANRSDELWRAIRWANSPEVALRCSASIIDFVLTNY